MIIGLATPSGESALALIRVSGADCLLLAKNVFNTDTINPRYASLAQYRGNDNTIIDQVIYIYYSPNASYTGEAMLEISCHGNPLITRKIIKDLLRRNCRIAEPGEFTRKAFLNGKMDLSQAEAVIDIISARSERALQSAQRQLRGGLKAIINRLIDELLKTMAVIEAYIDFPEEDLPEEDQEGPLKSLIQLKIEINQLIQIYPCSKLLKEGAKVVLIGLPNSGKSSLLNRLAQRERALVDEEAGTTRDFIEENIFIDDYSLRFIDTAGLRLAQTSVEKRGIAKTLEQAQEADLLLLVIDRSKINPPFSTEIDSLLLRKKYLIVENKIDLPQFENILSFPKKAPKCRISALTGEGVETLKEKIKILLEEDLNLSDSNNILINARHSSALETTDIILSETIKKLKQNEPSELIASDLKEALSELGKISGFVDNEKVLDKVFQNFCMGK